MFVHAEGDGGSNLCRTIVALLQKLPRLESFVCDAPLMVEPDYLDVPCVPTLLHLQTLKSEELYQASRYKALRSIVVDEQYADDEKWYNLALELPSHLDHLQVRCGKHQDDESLWRRTIFKLPYFNFLKVLVLDVRDQPLYVQEGSLFGAIAGTCYRLESLGIVVRRPPSQSRRSRCCYYSLVYQINTLGRLKVLERLEIDEREMDDSDEPQSMTSLLHSLPPKLHTLALTCRHFKNRENRFLPRLLTSHALLQTIYLYCRASPDTVREADYLHARYLFDHIHKEAVHRYSIPLNCMIVTESLLDRMAFRLP